MFHVKLNLFSKAKALESKIDMFHDKVIDSAMTFKKSVREYLNAGRSDEFKKVNKQLRQIEHDADQLRRDIENRLYSQNLIPDLRANVLEMVENLDRVINRFDEVSYQFYILNIKEALQQLLLCYIQMPVYNQSESTLFIL